MRWLTLLMIFPLIATGCVPDPIPDDPDAPQVEVDVQPATGGGGDIETATIPIRVQVTVDERRKRGPSILSDECECGCGDEVCHCRECDPFAGDQPHPSPPQKQRAGHRVTIDGSGRMTWTADGQRWWFDPGVRMADGQIDADGRWQYRNGQMIDLRRAAAQPQTRSPAADCPGGY